MANMEREVKTTAKKSPPYAIIETKEEFDHWFDKIYKSGRDDGLKRGTEMALAVFMHLVEQKFDDETIRSAQLIAGNIAKAEAISKMEQKEGDLFQGDEVR